MENRIEELEEKVEALAHFHGEELELTNARLHAVVVMHWILLALILFLILLAGGVL